MTARQKQVIHFLTKIGWAGAVREPLAGDASKRRYDRLQAADGRQSVLMDAPPEAGESVRQFVKIAQFLHEQGLSAPAILAADEASGFLLLEDLGDDLFSTVLTARPELDVNLYDAATDVLIALLKAPTRDLPRYSPRLLAEMTDPAFQWYRHCATGHSDEAEFANFETAFCAVLENALTATFVPALRDYHAENLLWLPERSGIARVGLLDFQDAVACHPAYDPVSLLQDARRDITAAFEAEIIDRYVRKTGFSADAFQAAYAVLGAQRNIRILGVFARLCVRDGKAHYIDYIPRVWRYLLRNLQHPALQDVAPMVLRTLPEPTKEILDKLKSRCATNQMH